MGRRIGKREGDEMENRKLQERTKNELQLLNVARAFSPASLPQLNSVA
jgi:hypothetical protein